MTVSNMKSAIKIVKHHMPYGQIQKAAEYKDLYLFIIYMPDPYEGQMDPFYSVSKRTGEFRDFAYLEDGIFEEVMNLFERTAPYKDVKMR